MFAGYLGKLISYNRVLHVAACSELTNDHISEYAYSTVRMPPSHVRQQRKRAPHAKSPISHLPLILSSSSPLSSRLNPYSTSDATRISHSHRLDMSRQQHTRDLATGSLSRALARDHISPDLYLTVFRTYFPSGSFVSELPLSLFRLLFSTQPSDTARHRSLFEPCAHRRAFAYNPLSPLSSWADTEHSS
jgi:hypothetical protein